MHGKHLARSWVVHYELARLIGLQARRRSAMDKHRVLSTLAAFRSESAKVINTAPLDYCNRVTAKTTKADLAVFATELPEALPGPASQADWSPAGPASARWP